MVGYRGTQAKIRRSDPTYYLGILNPRIAHVMCATEDIKQQLARFISPDRMTVSPKPYEVMWMEDVWAHPKSVAGIPSTAFQVICLANTKGRSFKGLRILDVYKRQVVMSGCMVIVPRSLSGFVINERHVNLCIGIITAVPPVIFFILIEFLTVVSGNDQDRIV